MTTPSPRRWLLAAAAARPDHLALAGDIESTYGELAAHAVAEAADGLVPIPIGQPGPATMARLWGAWQGGGAAYPYDARRGAPVVGDGGHDGSFALVRTSGTAGEGRAVALTEGNVAAAVAASRARLGTGQGDRWLLVLPLSHVGGLSVLWRCAEAGATVVVHERFEPAAVSGALRSGAATVVSVVPVMLRRLLDADAGPYPGPLVLLGGAAAPPELVQRGLDAGLRVLTSYGLTEACSQVATVAPGEERESLGTAGRPLDGMEVAIGPGGHITVQGQAVSPGYAGEPPRSGPLITSDLGRFDADGRLVVLGRADDVIVTGGENVHPAEVEALVAVLPGVAEVGVFGEPDAEWGQRVVAVVVAEEGRRFDPDAAAAALRAQAPPHLVPRTWRVAKELPRNPIGKVDRRALAGAGGAQADVAEEGV